MQSSAVPSAWGRIFLPFALGYYLSYLLRTVNAVISPALTADLDAKGAYAVIEADAIGRDHRERRLLDGFRRPATIALLTCRFAH